MLCVEAKAISESTLQKAIMDVKERTARLNKALMERGGPILAGNHHGQNPTEGHAKGSGGITKNENRNGTPGSISKT